MQALHASLCISLTTGKYPLEKGMTTHSSILAWRIPWTEATNPWDCRVRHDWATNTLTSWSVSCLWQNAILRILLKLLWIFFFKSQFQKEAPFGFGLENTGSEYAVRIPYRGCRGGYIGQGGASWKRDATSQCLPSVVVGGRWLKEGTVLQKISVMIVPCDGKAWPLSR